MFEHEVFKWTVLFLQSNNKQMLYTSVCIYVLCLPLLCLATPQLYWDLTEDSVPIRVVGNLTSDCSIVSRVATTCFTRRKGSHNFFYSRLFRRSVQCGTNHSAVICHMSAAITTSTLPSALLRNGVWPHKTKLNSMSQTSHPFWKDWITRSASL